MGAPLDSPTAQPEARAELDNLNDQALRALAVGELLDAVTLAKETRIANNDFERAAMLRDFERRLVTAIKNTQPSIETDETPSPDAEDRERG